MIGINTRRYSRWKNLLEEEYLSNIVIEAFREAKHIATFEERNLHCFLLGDMQQQQKRFIQGG